MRAKSKKKKDKLRSSSRMEKFIERRKQILISLEKERIIGISNNIIKRK